MYEEANHKGKHEEQEHNPAIITWIGTMHERNLTFYKMRGKYFVRSKSSLTRKRVKRDACFKKTREFAGKLGRASSIASLVYKQLPEGWKLHSLYRKLTGAGFQFLKTADHTDDEVIHHLWKYLQELGYNAETRYEEDSLCNTKYQESVARRVKAGKRRKIQKRRPNLFNKRVQAPDLKLEGTGTTFFRSHFLLNTSVMPELPHRKGAYYYLEK